MNMQKLEQQGVQPAGFFSQRSGCYFRFCAHDGEVHLGMGAEPEAAEAILNEKAGWLHSLLFKMLHIHTVPTLRFFHDDHLTRGLALSQLIDQVNRPSAAPAASDDPDVPDEQP